ncbi:transcription elongation factor A protein 3 [Gracilinanus agilis]|uniref:transcription elongation factor A protein 3 n=1 Tax=Gracilinanus agilis TaxID=191870 RepID=UPI001CFCBD2E|nr:transcription elongation factor A protein 3 [Gracilinanus agilis]
MGQEEELLRIAKKLDKMVSRKNTEGALDLLKKLSDYKMSIQLLQTTRIGIAVNGVRKHCLDKEVVALAKILIKNWKRLLDTPETPKKEKAVEREKEKKKEQNVDLSDWKPLGAFSPQSRSPREEPKDRYVARSQDPLDSTPGVIFVRQWAVFVGGKRGFLAISPWGGLLNSLTHIYQELKGTDMKYRNRVRSRISNLKDPRNPNLRRNVLCGAISTSLIARMTAEEMASDELKELRNAMTLEAIREHQMAKTGGTTTDLFQCNKCKKKNCTYNQVQTRSADEPMTTFVLCNECGNRWKFC